MIGFRFFAYSSISAFLFLALFVVNAYRWHSAAFGAVLLAWFLLLAGLGIGRSASPREHPAIQWWTGAWMALSLCMLAGAAAYYGARITQDAAVIVVALTVAASLWFAARGEPGFFARILARVHDRFSERAHRVPPETFAAAALAAFSLFLVFRHLSENVVIEAVRSPWTGMPPGLFVAFFAAAALVFAQLYRGRERALGIALLSVLLFAVASAALILYPIGFGFDSFIHQATEAHIAEHGTIEPKPFYYIGQYALVLILHHAFQFPIWLADKLLLPGLLALLLPLAWYSAAAHLAPSRRTAAATLAGVFLLPLAPFIVTTPQGLANLWILLTVFAAVPYLVADERPGLLVLAIGALATLATHPIAGLPVAAFVFLCAVEPRKASPRWRPGAHAAYWLAVAAGSVMLPISFMANAWRTDGTLSIDLARLSPMELLGALRFDVFFENRFSPILDFAYLYGLNALAILIAIASAGWWMHRHEQGRALRPVVLVAAMLAVNFALLRTAVDFSFLIDYERTNYADRLLPILAYVLAPLVILGLAALFSRLPRNSLALAVGAIALLAAVATSAFYLAYPRDDAYERSGGFNVSAADVQAVHAVERLAAGRPYVVLANQSVSAAAIRELGFERYYGDLFFYPIPTGGALYGYFLEMNDRPTREKAEEALGLVRDACGDCEVDTLFYIVNAYWWEAPRIVETAKGTADGWIAVDGGKVHIFEFSFAPKNETTP